MSEHRTAEPSRALLPCHGAQTHRAPQPPLSRGLGQREAHGDGAAIPAGWVRYHRSQRRSQEDGLSDLISLRIPATCCAHAVAARAVAARHSHTEWIICASEGSAAGSHPHHRAAAAPTDGFAGRCRHYGHSQHHRAAPPPAVICSNTPHLQAPGAASSQRLSPCPSPGSTVCSQQGGWWLQPTGTQRGLLLCIAVLHKAWKEKEKTAWMRLAQEAACVIVWLPQHLQSRAGTTIAMSQPLLIGISKETEPARTTLMQQF